MSDLTIQLKRAAQALAKDWHIEIPKGFESGSSGLGDAARQLMRRIAAANAPTWGQRLVWHALKDVGLTENPPGSNSGPRINEALKFCGLSPGQPWCAAIVSLWLHEMGYDGPWPASRASVASWEQMAAGRGLYVSASSAHAGDLVTFQFDADPQGDHMGLVTGAVRDGVVPTIEGNTSRDNTGSQSNGGGVFQRQRPVSVVHHFIRLKK